MRLTLHLAAIALVALGAAGSASAAEPTGTWLTQNGGSRIKIADCGGALCGTIVWLKEPNDEGGKPKTDKNNPDPAKRSRPLIGVMVLISMQPSGPSKWSGTLYDNDRGLTLPGHITEQDAATIRVEGCMGALCGGEDMTRVSEPARPPVRPKPADKRGGSP